MDICDNFTTEQIDNLFDQITRVLHEAAKVIGKSKYARHLKPYWCDELSVLKKDKMYWFTKWKKRW